MALDEADINTIIRDLAKGKGPATEDTAQKILASLDPNSRTAAQDKVRKSFMGLRDETEKAKKKQVDFSKFLSAAGTGFSSVTKGADGLIQGLSQVSYSMSGFNKVLVEAIANLSAIVFENVDVFRTLATIGANTSDNVNQLRFTAGQAGIDLDRLTTALVSTNVALAGFGGDAEVGARRFNQIITGLTQSNFRQNLTALGFSMGDITEGFADYVTLQTTLGRSQSMTNQQLVTGSQEYLLRLDQLSKLTGLQRDQVKAELQAVADARELRLISNDEIEATMVRVKAAAPEMVNAVTGILAKGFPEGGEQVGIFAVNGVREAVAALRDGVPGASDMFIQALARNGEEIANMDEANKKLIATQLGVGNEFFNIAADSIKFRKFLNQSTDAIIEEQKRRGQSTEGAKMFDQVSEDLRSGLRGLTVPLQNVIDSLIGLVAKGLKPLSDMVKALSEKFNNLSEETKNLIAGFTLAVGALGGGAVAYKGGKAIVGGVKSMFAGGGGGPQKTFMGPLNKIGAGGGGMMAGMGTGLKGLSSGMMSFANPAVLLGATNLGLSIAAIGAGIAGATFLMGGALAKFADGLKGIGEVDGGNLLQVAKGTLALSGAMVAMAGGGTVSAVSGFFGKLFGGGTDNFAKNINNMLEDLDKNKIDVYAKSLSDLGEGMQSIRTGLSSSIGASGSATGDKLEQLNTTMEQILMVLDQGNRYAKITSGATSEIRDYT
jgi:hypothetical protein